MALHVVVGAGGPGIATARLLAEGGNEVRLISRRGTAPDIPGVTAVAADASDPEVLVDALAGASTLYTCVMPRYDRWREEFPRLGSALLSAAEKSAVDYVMLGNAYGYGLVDGPYTPDLPMAPNSDKGRIRAEIWQDALAAHDAGRVRVTEIRASDFVGAGAVSPLTLVALPQLLTGQTVVYPGDVGAPHSWTATRDVAQALVAIAAGGGWGRAWHVPSTTLPVRAVVQRFAQIAGVRVPTVERMSDETFAAAAAADPIVAELGEMLYLDEHPFVLDAAETEHRFGVTATPIDDVLAESIADVRARAA
jgi:nucleoside-diphosphate-sugar epimerase